jgi:EAL domain-containing protein (putative c-di-GMP-specific phosphodiesterase class I)
MKAVLNIEVNIHNEDKLNHCLGAGGYMNYGVRMSDCLYRLTETDPAENADDLAAVVSALLEEGFKFTCYQVTK